MAKLEGKRRTTSWRILSHFVIVLAVGFLLERTSSSYDTTTYLASAVVPYQQAAASILQEAAGLAAANTKTPTAPALTIHSSSTSTTKLMPVNCSLIPEILPVNIARMASIPDDAPYLVSFSWWDGRIKRAKYKEEKRQAVLQGNKAVHRIQNLILNTSAASAFVDVGANVGFMSQFAARDRMVFAIDPISYDIAKLCEGRRANLEEGWAKPNVFHLYHAAAGPTNQPNVTITRPPDAVGYFDQSSLSPEAVQNLHAVVVEEIIPMITMDSIVPDDIPIGIVKIDVQGHEYGVLQGMKKILERTTGYPRYIFYEEQPHHLNKTATGFQVGACAKFLHSFGYTCHTIQSDVLCSKW